MSAPSLNGVLRLVISLCFSYTFTHGAMPFYHENGKFKYANGKDFGFISGVNVGASVPGTDPGTLSVSKEDYLRQFAYCRELNVNVVRIYTILNPEFYDALAEWNSMVTQEWDKIYIIQGVWSPEEELINHGIGADAYGDEITHTFEDNIERTVKAVHGGGILRNDYTDAAEYTTSIAEYVMAYMMGTEWDPNAVYLTNSGANKDVRYTEGKYVRTNANANAFESWLAKMLDHLCTISYEQYNYQVPVAFTNWVTTDQIYAPLEPTYNHSAQDGSTEDWQKADARNLETTDLWKAGYYFNQHAYPYYPDFLKFSLVDHNVPDYLLETTDYKEDSYLNYLARVKKVNEGTGLALILSEVGLSTSLGFAADGQAGRNHGHLSEDEQAVLLADLIRMVKVIGWDGILIFQLVDEWFKRSWNTLDYDWKRRTWHNALNAEQFFGLIAVEPTRSITVDGESIEKYRSNTKHHDYIHFGNIGVDHDEAYLYISIEKAEGTGDWNASDMFAVGFDTIPGFGAKAVTQDNKLSNLTVLDGLDVLFTENNDFMLVFNGSDFTNRYYSNIVTDPYYHFYWPWVINDNWGVDDAHYTSDMGYFKQYTQITQTPWDIPGNFTAICALDPLEDGTVYPGIKSGCKVVCNANDTLCDQGPGEHYDLGNLIRGSSDFTKSTFSSMSTWEVKGNIIETRIPWAMLGFGDPSTKTVVVPEGDSYKLVGVKTIKAKAIPVHIEEIKIEVVYNHMPDLADDVINTVTTYSWDNWEEVVRYTERRKVGYARWSDLFKQLRLGTDMNTYTFDAASAPTFSNASTYNYVMNPYGLDYTLYGWIFVGCSVFLIVMIFIIGVVYPITPILLFCYGGHKWESSAPGARNLIVVAGFIFACIVAGFTLNWFLHQQTPDEVFISALKTLADGQFSFAASDIGFWLWFFALQLDTAIMALIVLFVKWPTNPLAKKKKKKHFWKRNKKDKKDKKVESEMTLEKPEAEDETATEAAGTSDSAFAQRAGMRRSIRKSVSRHGVGLQIPSDEFEEPVLKQSLGRRTTFKDLNENGDIEVRPARVSAAPGADISICVSEPDLGEKVDASKSSIFGCSTTGMMSEADSQSSVDMCRDRHAFVIACHNSSEKISLTLDAALADSEPWQIFVGDNGSSIEEQEETRRICLILSLEYKELHPEYKGGNISYGFIQEGSKTVAQFAAVQFMLKTVDRTRIEYVTFIDDDTLIPDDWHEDEIVEYFRRDPDVQCLAYPLHATNFNSTLALFENYEYLIVGVNKMLQARMGSTIFASGAYSTWRLPVIGDILARHNTMHNGDDLQQGLILHKYCGKPFILDPDRNHCKAPKVVVAHVAVATDVPICWLHKKDWIPNYIMRTFPKTKPDACSCGEPSMWAQRGYGWDVSRHRFLLKFLQMIFVISPKMGYNWWLVRGFALFESIQIPYDWFILLYGWAFTFISIFTGKWLFLVSTFVIAWTFQILVGFAMNQFLLTPHKLRVPTAIIFFYPMLYKFYCITIIRACGMLYNALYYFPTVRNKEVIYKRWNNPDGVFKDAINQGFEFNDTFEELMVEEWEEMKAQTLPMLLNSMAKEHRKSMSNMSKEEKAKQKSSNANLINVNSINEAVGGEKKKEIVQEENSCS